MGYFEIGIYHPKNETNLGTLWRSALQLGAAGIFTIGKRYKKQSTDIARTFQHVPLRDYVDWEQFYTNRPRGAQLIAVEMGGAPLREFAHPDMAIYLLGAEDAGLPARILAQCQAVVSLESVGPLSYNVAVAGSLDMYDRVFGRR
jgi:tRNA G18 (ribose-2'-O)-methylase SpoU